jgi:hypothetical protein
MARKCSTPLVLSTLALGLLGLGVWQVARFVPGSVPARDSQPTAEESEGPLSGTVATSTDSLEDRFASSVQPFFKNHCFACHGSRKREASLDLSHDLTVRAIANNPRQWDLVLARLQAEEMPPEDAGRQPEPGERAAVIAWLRELRDREAQRNAGDPGVVLARRLSNAEFDYTIRDLTGVDLRPTREFPVDPANEAGFDNSGESLTMSPALLKKYLAAARLVADHVVLKPDGFVFAPHPVVTETDRDKYCVRRIIDFYDRHQVDLADYFHAAWKYRHRDALGRTDANLGTFSSEAGLSAKYLAMVWAILAGPDAEAEPERGPLLVILERWRELPGPAVEAGRAARVGCERLRDLVVRLRRLLEPPIGKLQVKGISPGSQTLVLWSNRQRAAQHRRYSGEVVADCRKLVQQLEMVDPSLAKLQAVPASEAETTRMRGALERFCSVFPAAFVISDRGPYFDPKAAGKGRPLTAGFHLMQGHFRDDAPLCELILDERQRRELDELWHELNFVTLAPMRQYKDFIFFERAEPPRYMREAEFDFARSEDKDAISEAKMKRLAEAYLAKARTNGASSQAVEAIETSARRWRRSKPISQKCQVKFAGSSAPAWPPSRATSRPSCGSPSGPIAGLWRARNATNSRTIIARCDSRRSWATRKRCAIRWCRCCCLPISATASIWWVKARPCSRCRITPWPAG